MLDIIVEIPKADLITRMSKNLDKSIERGLANAMKKALIYAQVEGFGGRASRKMAGANTLVARTGRLQSSIRYYADKKSDRYFEGGLYSNEIYARVHEEGHHFNETRLRKFRVDGRWYQTTSAYDIPARPYLFPALEDHLREHLRMIANEIEESIRRI